SSGLARPSTRWRIAAARAGSPTLAHQDDRSLAKAPSPPSAKARSPRRSTSRASIPRAANARANTPLSRASASSSPASRASRSRACTEASSAVGPSKRGVGRGSGGGGADRPLRAAAPVCDVFMASYWDLEKSRRLQPGGLVARDIRRLASLPTRRRVLDDPTPLETPMQHPSRL